MPCEPVAEGASLHELHREIRDPAGVHGELVNRDDVRVLELPGHLSLGNEAVAVEGLARVVLVETLECDVAQQIAVGRRMDVPHATARELAVDNEVWGRRYLFGF